VNSPNLHRPNESANWRLRELLITLDVQLGADAPLFGGDVFVLVGLRDFDASAAKPHAPPLPQQVAQHELCSLLAEWSARLECGECTGSLIPLLPRGLDQGAGVRVERAPLRRVQSTRL
jgi:hypothetical protein